MCENNYIYSFNYDINESDLCKLESRYIFDNEEKNKLLFSSIKVEPSNSAFIKKRLDIITSSANYATLIANIKKENIYTEGFKVEYLMLDGDVTEYAERLKKLRDIGYSIEGDSDYYTPTITYALCHYNGVWYFGILIKNSFVWHKHKKKPCSFSNSISVNIAKTLVNIAANRNNKNNILDACCGVGTIMLEACFAGINIEGSDINWKICKQARENLAYFNYKSNVYRADISDISKIYDAVIIDLPYNIYSNATDDQILHIITSAAKLTNYLVVVSTSDISGLINTAALTISDYCIVKKIGKAKFTRKIWVCKK